MRVTRRDQYSSYSAPSRLSNDLVYRDFLHQERHAFQEEPRKKNNLKRKRSNMLFAQRVALFNLCRKKWTLSLQVNKIDAPASRNIKIVYNV